MGKTQRNRPRGWIYCVLALSGFCLMAPVGVVLARRSSPTDRIPADSTLRTPEKTPKSQP